MMAQFVFDTPWGGTCLPVGNSLAGSSGGNSPGNGQPKISNLMQMFPLSNQDCGFMRM